ncbi:MAG: biotin-dependent carboxyltransferase family protein [Thermodesulfobacteriota bacterium]
MRSAGPLATVQDLGRRAWQHMGVPVAGAMDSLALRLANLAAGNPEGAAGIEVTLGGLEAEFLSPARFAVAGPGTGVRLNGTPVPAWECRKARAGDVLRLDAPAAGARDYLAVAGGIAVPPVLGSRSTYLRGGFGGLEGRPLRAGDVLPVGLEVGEPRGPVPPTLRPDYAAGAPLRVVLGPQEEAFPEEALAAFLAGTFRVTPRADRMGCLLDGPRLAHRGGADIVSEGIAEGSVQVPGDGRPILLLADRPTTGGYAKIATVACVDLPRAAQLLPGSEVRFAAVSLWEARELLLWREYAVGRYKEGAG